MINRLAITAAAAVLFGGAAFAQTASSPNSQSTAPASPSMNATTSTAAGTTMSGIRMAHTADVPVRFMTISPAEVMATKLIGVNVYNNKQESLGEIEDVAIENGKTINGVVVSVGGFLGIGESYVLIDPSTLVLNNDNGTMKAYVDTTKDTLKGAPKFTYSKKKS